MALDTTTWQRQLVNLIPSGTIDITENGEYDVSKYATADVNVSGGQMDVGNTVVIFATTGDIIIGEQASFENYTLSALYYGDVSLIFMNSQMGNCNITANLTVEIEYADATVDGFYAVSLDNTDKFTSVEEVDIEYTLEYGILTFTVPDLSDDPDNPAYLFIKFIAES